jgi:hypothetical protein
MPPPAGQGHILPHVSTISTEFVLHQIFSGNSAITTFFTLALCRIIHHPRDYF